jgi:hypothetical protein
MSRRKTERVLAEIKEGRGADSLKISMSSGLSPVYIYMIIDPGILINRIEQKYY